MITIRKLAQKYGGIFAEFVTRCEQEGNPCIVEESGSKLLIELVSAMKSRKLLTEKQAKYSCSEKLYDEMKERAIKILWSTKNPDQIDAMLLKWDLLEYLDFSSILKTFTDKGDIKGAEWTLKRFSVSDLEKELDNEDIFSDACRNGQLEAAKWIVKTLPMKMIENEVKDAFDYACENGHLELVQWLISTFEIRTLKPAFIAACKFGHLAMAQRIVSVTDNEYTLALIATCANGYLEVAQWIFSVWPDIPADTISSAFCTSIFKGHLDIAKCIFSIRPDIILGFEHASLLLNQACFINRLDIAKWLLHIWPNCDLDIALKNRKRDNKINKWLEKKNVNRKK